MSEITNRVVKESRKLANKVKSRSSRLTAATGKFLNNTVKSSGKIAKDFTDNSINVYKHFEKGNITQGIKGTGNLFSHSLQQIVNNEYLNIVLKIIIAIYTAFIINHTSKGFVYFFDNLIVKILVALLIVYVSSKDPSLAILISLSYILTLQQANKYRLIEKSQKVEPTFNNEYFNYDSENSISSGEVSTELNNEKNYMQKDFNEKPNSLNQNYQTINTPDKLEGKLEIDSESLYNPHQLSQNNTYITKNENSDNTYLSENDNNEKTPDPIPMEKTIENKYQSLSTETYGGNINTPENESLDFSSRIFDDQTQPLGSSHSGDNSLIQGYQKNSPLPYSTGDLGYSNI